MKNTASKQKAESNIERDGTTNLIKHAPQKTREDEASRKITGATLSDLWPK